MQYAPEPLSVAAAPRLRPRVRRAVLDELDKPDVSASFNPAERSANTGIGGSAPPMTDTRMPNPGEAPKPSTMPSVIQKIQENPSRAASALMGASPSTMPSPVADFSAAALMPILRKYQHTPEGLQKAFAENPHWGAAGSKVQGGDIFNPSTGRWLDVIQGASRGGENWQYLDEQEGGADYSPQAQAQGAPGSAMRGMDPSMTSIIDQIRQSILALMGPQSGAR